MKTETDGLIPIAIKQKSIAIKKLIKLTNEYIEVTNLNPLWTAEDNLHILNFFRFLEQRLKK